MSFEQAGKDDDWRGSAGQLGWKSSKLSSLHESMSFIAPCKIFYHEFYPKKYKENHTFFPGSKKNDAEKWQVATEMTTAAALVTGGTSMAGAIEVAIEVEVDGSKGWIEDLSTQV